MYKPTLTTSPLRVNGTRQMAVAACNGDIEDRLIAIHHQTVGARHIVEQTGDVAIGADAENAPGGVVQTGETLIGEIEVAVARKEEVVDRLEALEIGAHQVGRHLAAQRIEQHDSVLVVGDEDAPVLMDLESIGQPSYSFAIENSPDFETRKDPAVRNIDAPEIALAIEHGPLEQRSMMGAGRLGLDPVVAVIGVVPDFFG